MYRHVVAVFVMIGVVVISVIMGWLMQNMRTGQPRLPWQKGWQKRDISVREAEWQLDTNAYLEEQWQWAPVGFHHEYLCQQMFFHAATTGQSEYDHAIYQGWKEPSLEWDLGTDPTAMELICPKSTQEDIGDLYWDVY